MIWVYRSVVRFMSTPLGRALAAAGVIIGAVLAILAYGEAKGKREAEQAGMKRELRAARKKRKIEDEVRSLNDNDLVFRSGRWMR